MRRLVFVALLAVPCVGGAQTIYKVQTSDGSILFTDTPPPGSKVLEERSAKATPRPATATAARPAVTPSVAPIAGAVPRSQGSSLEATMQELASDEAAVQVAKRRLELGREPLPGERRGLAGGGSRLTPEYEARIAGLEREVADAEARLQRAQAARNSR